MIPYIRLLTLPTGPHNPHTLTEHHLINANKSFSRDQLVREEGVKLGRGGSEEGKKAEERVKVLLESGEEGVEDVNHGVSFWESEGWGEGGWGLPLGDEQGFGRGGGLLISDFATFPSVDSDTIQESLPEYTLVFVSRIDKSS